MSTNGVRRGPGWWMDLEGSWNPPEDWPETSPPLPGWVRGESGSWSGPAGSPVIQPAPEPGATARGEVGSTVTKPTLSRAVLRPVAKANLHYAANDQHEDPNPRERSNTARRAVNAAVLAAITASMIAGGAVLLLLLF